MAENQLYKIYKSTMSQIADCTRAIAGINFDLTPEEIIRYLKNYAKLSLLVSGSDIFELFVCSWPRFSKPKATETIEAFCIDDMQETINESIGEFPCVVQGFTFSPQTKETISANDYSGEGVYEFINLNPRFIDSSYECLAKVKTSWLFPSQIIDIDRGQARSMKCITNDLASVSSIQVVNT